jgi:hypothetical protein
MLLDMLHFHVMCCSEAGCAELCCCSPRSHIQNVALKKLGAQNAIELCCTLLCCTVLCGAALRLQTTAAARMQKSTAL